MAAKKHLTLPNGQKMPTLGLGTSNSSSEDLERAINAALENGYRHIDTALLYNNEETIGKVLEEWFLSEKIERSDLFITTKLPIYGIHPDRVQMLMEKSLKNLRLDYVDLYLLHFPVGSKYVEGTGFKFDQNGTLELEGRTDHGEIWKKMEAQVDAGRAKNIGLSNYSIPQIETILKSARIPPATLQIELHLYLQQHELVDFCNRNNITVVAYGPLGSPGFNKVLEAYGKKPIELPNILGDPVVLSLAHKHSKTPAQIALRFLLQRGVAAIPKSVNIKRIQENIDVFDFSLTDNDMKELFDLEVGESARVFDMKVLEGIDGHPDYPWARNDASCETA